MGLNRHTRRIVLSAAGVVTAGLVTVGLVTAALAAPTTPASTPVSGVLAKQWSAPLWVVPPAPEVDLTRSGPVTVTADGSTAYVDTDAHSFTKIDLASHAMSKIAIPEVSGNYSGIALISDSTSPQALTISPDGRTGFTEATGTIAGASHVLLLKIALATDTVTGVVDLGVGQQTVWPVVSPDGATVYAASGFAPDPANSSANSITLWAVNAASWQVTASQHLVPTQNVGNVWLNGFAASNTGVYVEFTGLGTTEFASMDQLRSFDPTTLTQTGAIDLKESTLGGGAGNTLAIDGTNVLVGKISSGDIEVADAAAGPVTKITRTITGLNLSSSTDNPRTPSGAYSAPAPRWGGTATGITSSTDGSKLFVASAFRLETVDFATGKVLSTVPMPGWGPYPQYLALSATGIELYTSLGNTFTAYTTNG